MSRARRSTRRSGATAKYTDDPFELAGITVSDEEQGGKGKKPDSTRQKGKGKAAAVVPEHSSGEEFEAENDVDAEDDEEEEGDYVDEDTGSANEDHDDEDVAFSEEGEPAVKVQKGTLKSQPRLLKQRRPDGTLVQKPDDLHTRGTWNPLEHVGKAVHLRVTFGSDRKDLLSIVYVRDRWAGGIDSTLPSRATLNGAASQPDYAYGSTCGAEPDAVRKEKTRGWDWYYSADVGARFRKRQRLESVTEDEARQGYIPQVKDKKHTVLMGPADEQTVFELAQHDVVDFGEAWEEEIGLKDSSTREKKQGSKSSSAAEPKQPRRKKRQGWMINFGQKVQCMAWAPNQAGLTQYLAVVVPISKEQKDRYPDPMKDQAAASFRPSPPYPCALQLWAFKAERSESLTKTLDMKFKPRLRLALCTDWGDLRRIAWCPMAREVRDEDDEEPLKNVGLLAGVWSDGSVRVIDVKLGRDPSKTEFYKARAPVFEAKPPSTVCTCVTWLSPSDIAVGCANGFVAIWSIAPTANSPQNPLPYFYQPIHSTYVLNVASAYPTSPHLLSTTSMDGETRLSSIIDYQTDMVATHRMRAGSSHLTYSPLLHSFISSDENDFARLLAIRRFYTTSAVARLPSTVSALAPSSTWHPSLLFGCTSGSVVATNPLRRLLHSKEKQWQQTWFTHEWANATEADSSGVSRFYDGYRAESVSLLRNMIGDRKMVNGVMVITIFDEETHVTAVSWNPNQTCAGWASAALGCGLVRVEDLAI